MLMLGPLGFTAPWVLLALASLPILWLILRAVPPAPIRRRFPGVALLFGLKDEDSQADRTPWWLLALRMLALAAVILGFAGPVLNPVQEVPGRGPLLIVTDASWASARDWPRRTARIGAALDEAGRAGRQVALVALSDLPPGALEFQSAGVMAGRLPALAPAPFAARAGDVADWVEGLSGGFDTFWLSDGLDHAYRAPLLEALDRHGSVRIFESTRPVLALRPARIEEGLIALTALRVPGSGVQEAGLVAVGLDPNGIERELARATFAFEAGQSEAEGALNLPPELRNRVTRFEIEGQRSAGAVSLTDDALKRREVGLVDVREGREGLELLSQQHYLRQALAPSVDLISGSLTDLLPANPDVIVLSDVATLSPAEAGPLLDWVEAGGLLLRFAGPTLAASDIAREAEDPLMPVRLRVGGRSVGGAMSWGAPKTLRAFSASSPFFGLEIGDDVTVSAQVMAQPDPELSARVIAALSDGTPLVTRKTQGLGQVVLFHVTANAEWSTLPLSGLFVQMLERLTVTAGAGAQNAAALEGRVFTPSKVLDGFGRLSDAGTLPGVAGEALVTPVLGPDLRPGIYGAEDRAVALNVMGAQASLAPAQWPAGAAVEGLEAGRETRLKGWLLAAAMCLLALDALASLWLSGRLTRGAGRVARGLGIAAAVGFAAGLSPGASEAQSDDNFAIQATREVVLAHVLTGDGALDDLAQAGLSGLSRTLFQRTSIEPAEPIGVDVETDELAFFPFLYWPVSADQPLPSAEAYVKLNRYLRGGGMILFDTRDANVAGFGAASPEGKRLQAIARPLDIPPLEPIPSDHVLTRTFYLLQDFPGRHNSLDVWVEAAPADAVLAPGMPFRNLNDNVTPVVIGGNDWAAAWAIDARGAPLLPVGRGLAGERQREIALRFGVNLVMHVLTGNYKSDQVHVPALLDRLGQ